MASKYRLVPTLVYQYQTLSVLSRRSVNRSCYTLGVTASTHALNIYLRKLFPRRLRTVNSSNGIPRPKQLQFHQLPVKTSHLASHFRCLRLLQHSARMHCAPDKAASMTGPAAPPHTAVAGAAGQAPTRCKLLSSTMAAQLFRYLPNERGPQAAVPGAHRQANDANQQCWTSQSSLHTHLPAQASA